MPIQQLATLWTPQIWIPGIAEKQASFPYLFNSKAVKRTDLLTELASGPGTYANVPFLHDITDQPNEVQVEQQAPQNIQGQPGDVNLFPILNRVTKNSWTAMAKNVSNISEPSTFRPLGGPPMGGVQGGGSTDIVSHVWGTMGERRLKQYQITLVNLMRGIFANGGATNVLSALTNVRYGGLNAEIFTENGNGAGQNNLMSPEIFIYMKALMGELGETLMNGAFWVHPNVLAQLEILDAISFKTVEPGLQSALPFRIKTYREIPIFISQALARAGTISGFVYDSYIIAEGTVGFGEKPQAADMADLASLAYFFDRDLNDDIIWDRTRTAMGVDGVAFNVNGIANGGSSAADSDLLNPANWTLKYLTPNRVGVVSVRTNG